MTERSITRLIADLKNGDEEAAQRIWEHFFDRLCQLARHKVGRTSRRARDEEDLALSAFDALFRGAREGRFRKLDSSDDLWMLLAQITTNKAISHWRHATRRKEVGESMRPEEWERKALAPVLEGQPTEEFLETLSLTAREFLERLDGTTRQVAMLRLEGHGNAEMAERIGRSVRSVERYLFVIRAKWSASDA